MYVSNLPYSYGDEVLKTLFQSFGPVSANVLVNKYNGRSKGIGFVEFQNEETQKKALEEMNGTEAQSENGPRTISIDIAMVKYEPKNENGTEE